MEILTASKLKVILSVIPIKYPLTGIGRYTYELGKELVACDQIDLLLFAKRTRFVNSLPKAGEKSSWMSRIFKPFLKQPWALSCFRTTENYFQDRYLREFEDHVYHGPNFYLPRFRGRSVVTFHDLSPCFHPAWHPQERVSYMQQKIEFSLRHASMLITVSEFVRREVIERFSWPSEKIVSVPLASAEEFYPRPINEVTPVLSRYNLSSGSYLLHVGTIEPRKNIEALLDAYSMLSPSFRRRCPLVLAGYQGWNSDSLHKRIVSQMSNNEVRYLGFIPDGHLPFLFAGARLFVLPSFYEGFGLPVLEAMSSGVPVVCSDSSSLLEVAGDAAAMFHPGDIESLKCLIEMGIEDEQWRSDAVVKGLAQAKRFSWRRCALETVAVYQAALNL